jgi:hypothetical protein
MGLTGGACELPHAAPLHVQVVVVGNSRRDSILQCRVVLPFSPRRTCVASVRGNEAEKQTFKLAGVVLRLARGERDAAERQHAPIGSLDNNRYLIIRNSSLGSGRAVTLTTSLCNRVCWDTYLSLLRHEVRPETRHSRAVDCKCVCTNT